MSSFQKVGSNVKAIIKILLNLGYEFYSDKNLKKFIIINELIILIKKGLSLNIITLVNPLKC